MDRRSKPSGPDPRHLGGKTVPFSHILVPFIASISASFASFSAR